MNTIVISFAPEFEELALNELRRIIGSFAVTPLSPGTHAIRFEFPYRNLVTRWRTRPPIYVHHLFPVLRHVYLAPTATNLLSRLGRLLRKTTLLRRLERHRSFTVQAWASGCLPAVPTATVEAGLEHITRELTGAPVDVRSPAQVLSVLLTEGGAFLGLSAVANNVSPWPAGAPPIPPDRDRINRAECKLVEALQVFGIRLQPGGRVLDLGAGPGGWTRILLQQGQTVTAVSPKPLVESLQHDPRVDFHQMTGEDFVKGSRGPYDFITNDMYAFPQDTARLMVDCARHLRPKGMAIVTLKLRSSARRRLMSHSFRILRRAFVIPRVKHLYFNHNEVTVWLRKR